MGPHSTSTSPRPIRKWATQQEVSSEQVSETSSANPHCSPSIALPPEPSPPHPWKIHLPQYQSLLLKRPGTTILTPQGKHIHIYTHMHPTPVLLPGKSHGWRSLVGCSPWGCEESETTERLRFHFSLSFIGAGNGNPLQCSCLENPRDGGAWWAAVSGVTQSQTGLK